MRIHNPRLLVAVLAAAAAAVALLPTPARAQFDFGGPTKRELPPAVRADVPFIKCGACQLYVKHALRAVRVMREELKPGKKVRVGVHTVFFLHAFSAWVCVCMRCRFTLA